MLPRKLYYISPDRRSLIWEPSYIAPAGRLVEVASAVTLARLPATRTISAYTVDPDTEAVFWVDNTGRVERLSPSGDRAVLAEAGPGVDRLGVAEGRLYWRKGNLLSSTPVNGGGEVEGVNMRTTEAGSEPVLVWTSDNNKLQGVDKDGNSWTLTDVPAQRVWRQGPNLVFFTTPDNTVSGPESLN